MFSINGKSVNRMFNSPFDSTLPAREKNAMKEENTRDNSISLKRNKKPHGKEKPNKKSIVEEKKTRPPLIHNRFTKILDLPNRSSPSSQYFGSLVFDFSRDPVFIRIVDTSGNYLLEISPESLREFKLEVLIGEDKRSKPNFTILLGDCQCYPELPEGPLPLDEYSDNKETPARREFIEEEKELPDDSSTVATKNINPAKLNTVYGVNTKKEKTLEDVDFAENGDKNRKTSTNGDKMNRSAIFNCSEKVSDSKEGVSGGGDATLSLSEAESLPKETTSTSRIRVKDKESSSIRKERRDSKEETKTQKPRQRVTKSEYASTLYKSNLEKFIGYLMKDDAFTPVSNAITTLNKALVDSNSTIGGRRFVKTLEGNSYVVNFQDPNPEKIDKLRKMKMSNDELQIFNDNTDEQREKIRREVKFFDEHFQSNQRDFKADSRHLDCKGEVSKCAEGSSNEAISFDGTKSDVSTSSSQSILSSKSNEPKTVKKVEEEFDSATSDCGEDLIKQDSLEEFFLSLRENDESKKMKKYTLSEERTRVFHEMKTEPPSEHHFKAPSIHEYAATVETMWLSFIRLLFPNIQKETDIARNLIPNSAPQNISRSYPIEQVVQYKIPTKAASAGQFCDMRTEGNIVKNANENGAPNSTVKCDGTNAPVHLSNEVPITGKRSKRKARMFFNPNVVTSGSWWLR